jgi:hypothetical protein
MLPTPFRAIENRDTAMVDELWNDDIAVWHSGDRRDGNRDRALRVIYWFINRASTRRYEILDRQLFEGGFVQQHIMHAQGIDRDAGLHRDQGGCQRPDQPYRRVLRPSRHGPAAHGGAGQSLREVS